MKKSFVEYVIFTFTYLILLASFPIEISSAQAQILDLDLLSQQTIWQPFAAAVVTQNRTSLGIYVITNYTGDLFNRAYLPISVNSSDNKPIILALKYASASYFGNATFFAEIRDNRTNDVLWSDSLNNTNGQMRDQIFVLPVSVLNKPVEFRFYIITNGIGEHSLIFNKVNLSFYNVTQRVTVETS